MYFTVAVVPPSGITASRDRPDVPHQPSTLLRSGEDLG
jgi:hypothetical protein